MTESLCSYYGEVKKGRIRAAARDYTTEHTMVQHIVQVQGPGAITTDLLEFMGQNGRQIASHINANDGC